jgi:ABC-2 type transport system ATP-binding protein
VRNVADHGVITLTSNPPTLEQLFMHHYGDDPDAAAAVVA